MKTLKFHLTVGIVAATTFFSCNNSDNATYGGDNYSLERKMYPAIPNVFN